MSTCLNCTSAGANLSCTRCNAVYCSTQCQTDHWPAHKPICTKHTAAIRKQSADEASQYLEDALRNQQLLKFICARMGAAELYGMNRAYASVFLTRTITGTYRGTFTMINQAPVKRKSDRNCIEFSYICNGKSYTECRYIGWQKCKSHQDEFKQHGINIFTNRRTIEFESDQGHFLELFTA